MVAKPPSGASPKARKTALTKASERDARRQRLDDALRENLKKRKHQARARAAAPASEDG